MKCFRERSSKPNSQEQITSKEELFIEEKIISLFP